MFDRTTSVSEPSQVVIESNTVQMGHPLNNCYTLPVTPGGVPQPSAQQLRHMRLEHEMMREQGILGSNPVRPLTHRYDRHKADGDKSR